MQEKAVEVSFKQALKSPEAKVDHAAIAERSAKGKCMSIDASSFTTVNILALLSGSFTKTFAHR